ncbi:MAG: GNAT family N-acetyltransferase [Deltaproteobacteria bacterium]|nr:MAG: GNAT family N-acetyltransferase [Deltaproteobacteria bacterium]
MIAPAEKLQDVVALRRARPEDCEAIWRWNFAADVRAQSKRAEAVAFLEHARWFARRLADGDAPIWVIEEYHHGVGVVRLDPPQHGRARISIALAAFARGRGVGRAAIAAACRSRRRPIVAEIFADNIASCACFEACEFRPIAVEAGLVTYYWDPEK